MEILGWMGIGAALMALGLFLWQRLLQRIDEQIAARTERFFEPVKTDIPQSEENTLAKEKEILDNPLDTQAEVGSPPLPFWNDKDKLRSTMERIQGSVLDPDSEEALANLSPIEQLQMLDSRILELEDLSESELNAGHEPSIS